MLSIEQREFIKNYSALYKTADNSEKPLDEHAKLRQMNKRIRDRALQAMKDLKYIAETMPEDQLNQIFSFENLRPLLESITSPELTIAETSKKR